MRLYILRALLVKEVRRHLANRGGLALIGLLIVAALLLSFFNPNAAGAAGQDGMVAETGGLVGGVHHCFIEYGRVTPLVRHLQKAPRPPELQETIRFREIPPSQVNELITYPPGVGSIQIRETSRDGRPVLQFHVWHPKDAPGAMAGYEQWFWQETRRGLQEMAVHQLTAVGADAGKLGQPQYQDKNLWAIAESFHSLSREVELIRSLAPGPVASDKPLLPEIEIRHEALGGTPLDLRSAIATAMVVFSLYFTCVYLLPTLNCEERERGILLAQALSPASPYEILMAKFLFYPVIGIGLAALLAGIYKPEVLSSLFFWLSLLSVAGGFLGIGMTVATLAKTQRAAFMGSMCYLMSVALLLFICQQNGIPGLPYLALEYHGPRILHAAIVGEVYRNHWLHLIAAIFLAWCWVFAAGWLFRRRGWQ
ncbi:MAG: ABC transporter permease [Bacteroidales bacterium]|nr:ABC transporter permease [Bacteroidales bacterium]